MQWISMVQSACSPRNYQRQGPCSAVAQAAVLRRATGLSDGKLPCCGGEQTQRGTQVQSSQVSRGAVCKAAGEGAQQETASFAEWEQHTRGIASRIMARLGYVQGRALGQRGSGLTAPLQVNLVERTLQAMDKLSLDAGWGCWFKTACTACSAQGRLGRARLHVSGAGTAAIFPGPVRLR